MSFRELGGGGGYKDSSAPALQPIWEDTPRPRTRSHCRLLSSPGQNESTKGHTQPQGSSTLRPWGAQEAGPQPPETLMQHIWAYQLSPLPEAEREGQAHKGFWKKVQGGLKTHIPAPVSRRGLWKTSPWASTGLGASIMHTPEGRSQEGAGGEDLGHLHSHAPWEGAARWQASAQSRVQGRGGQSREEGVPRPHQAGQCGSWRVREGLGAEGWLPTVQGCGA